MSGYKLTKDWWNFTRSNLDKINSNHTAMYFYIVEVFNQNGWVEVIGLPTDFTMTALNIGSYKTYKKILDDLIEFKFVKMVERSKNQFTSNKIALVKNTKAMTKAIPLQVESNDQSTDQSSSSIIKLLNLKTIKLIKHNYKLINKNLESWISKSEESNEKFYRKFNHLKLTQEEFKKINETYSKEKIDDVLDKIENYKKNTSYKSLNLTLKAWLKKEKDFEQKEKPRTFSNGRLNKRAEDFRQVDMTCPEDF